MRFHYVASQPNGKIIEGDMDAKSSAEVLVYLASQGLKPVSLKTIKTVEEASRWKFLSQTVTIADKVFLTRFLALMLKVGTDLFKAVDILIADFEKPALKSLLIEIRGALEKGQPFYSTFAKYPKYFSPVFTNSIKAGETSGKLESVFEKLSASLQKEQDLRHKIRASLAYPILLLAVSTLILILLVSFALPKIADIFTTGGFSPPLFSKIVFSVGLFIGKYVWFILSILAVLIIASWFFFSKTLTGRSILYILSVKSPVIRNVMKQLAIQRFASTLSSLLFSGLAILDALEITAEAVGFKEIKDALIRISREGVSKGLTLGEAFRREPVFPRAVVNLIAISEKAGHLEQMLATLSDFYESEIEASIKSMVSFLEPVLLLAIGLVVAVIALAIIVPIYQLVGQF
jgi:type II secretory pathway component PulF